jgi:hypothetical protein
LDGSPPISAIASRIARGRHRGDAREVLHHHARGREGDLLGRVGLRVPGREGLDVLAADGHAVLVAQEVLEEDLEREREPGDVELRLQRVEAEDLEGPVADLQLRAGVEGVV